MHGKIRVAVLMGGPSAEHEVSLASGNAVLANLDPVRYEGFPVVISKAGEWGVPISEVKQKADVAFIALHGTYGEDGTVQAILDSEGIAYTGSSAPVSALAMNKYLSTRIFRHQGYVVPLTFLMHKREWVEKKTRTLGTALKYAHVPAVVKPNSQGSSVGVALVHDARELEAALDDIFTLTNEALIQQYVSGVEVTCGVLDHGWEDTAFPLVPTEIVPSAHFFDYKSKYESGALRRFTPARLPEPTIKAIQRTAVAAHRAISARGFSRTDMIVDPKGEIFILEINTIPGLSDESLLPEGAAAAGMNFPELINTVIQAALRARQ